MFLFLQKFCSLPPELLDKVLSMVSLDEFLGLYNLSSIEAQDVLGDVNRVGNLLRSNFGADFEAFEWGPIPSLSTTDLSQLNASYSTSLHEITRISLSLNKNELSDTLPLGAYHSQRASNYVNLIATVASDLQACVAVLSHSNKAVSYIDDAILNMEPKVDVSIASWARFTLHLQQFCRSVHFFLNIDIYRQNNLEQCLFEVARCQLEFSTLANYRLRKIQEIRLAIAAFNKSYPGNIRFTSIEGFAKYMKIVIGIILKELQCLNSLAPVDGNLLRYYKGETRATRVLCLIVVAKFLQEEIYDKIGIFIKDRRLANPQILVTSHFIILENFLISVSQEDMSISFYDRAHQNPSLVGLKLNPLKAIDIVETAFNSESEILRFDFSNPLDLDSTNWSIENLSSSKERLRFIRTLLISVCKKDTLPLRKFKSLIENLDFCSYYACACKMLGISLDNCVSIFNEVSISSYQRQKHFVVLNARSQYIGVQVKDISLDITSYYKPPDKCYSVLPFDAIEDSVALKHNISLLEKLWLPHSFVPFLKWLLHSEGISHATRYWFTTIYSDDLTIFFDCSFGVSGDDT